MKRLMAVLAIVLVLAAGLELSGCKKPAKAGKPQPTERIKKTTKTKPALDNILDEEGIPPPSTNFDSLPGEGLE